MASGFFLSFLLTISASIKHQGLLFNGGYLTTFWQNDEGGIINRTGLSLYGVGALSFATAYIFEKSKYRRIVYIILSVLLIVFIIAMSLIASNRALIVVCLFVLLFFVVKFMLKTSNKYVSISILIFIIVTFFLFFLIFSGLLRMPDWFYQIPIVKRFMSSDYNSDSSRLELYKVFFTNFYKYPFGGMNKLEGFTHVHNIVLDIYTYGGAIPFVLFFAFLLSYIYQLFKANKAKTIPIPIFALLLSFSLYTFGLGMFEPIYNANPNIMTPIFMIYFYVCYKSNKNDYYGSIDCKYYEVSI